MCLVVFAIDPEPGLRLLLAANRDEFHARPAAALARWESPEGVAGGRDLKAGGSWLAAEASGRFATVTNSRDAVPPRDDLRSRGQLVTDFLTSTATPAEHVQDLQGQDYAGFNLLVADASGVGYASNRNAEPRALGKGVYGLSNATLDTPWHKTEKTRDALSQLIGDRVGDEQLFDIMRDTERAPIETVSASHLSKELAHRLSSPFIVGEDYGTRCSTVVRLYTDGRVELTERRFNPDGSVSGQNELNLSPG